MALTKLLPMDVLLADPDVAENWRLDKLERKAGFSLLQGLAAQFDNITATDTFKKCTIPADVHIQKQGVGQRVMIDLDSGEDPRVETCSELSISSHLVLPYDFMWSGVLALLHVLDRSSVGR